jgi:hypothetical protein
MKTYKAYIAANVYTKAFDFCTSNKSSEAAIAAVKRKNSPDWKDCIVWAVIVAENGDEFKL